MQFFFFKSGQLFIVIEALYITLYIRTNDKTGVRGEKQPGLIIIKLLDPYNAVRANNTLREGTFLPLETRRNRDASLPRWEKVEARNDIREL